MYHRISRILGIPVVLGALAVVLPAQTATMLRADVPFEFTVGKAVMPAGLYQIQTHSSIGNVVKIDAVRGKEITFVFVQGTEANTRPEETKLVFNKYDDRYFLSQIWTAGDSRGLTLAKQRAEKELLRTASSRQTVVLLLASR